MSYSPNANDATNPLDTTDRSTAANEFRTLKNWLHGITTVASSATPDIFNAATQAINYTGTVLATGFVAALEAGMVRRLFIPSAAQFTTGPNLTIDGVASGVTVTINPGSVILVVAVTTTSFRIMMEADVGTIQGYIGEVRPAFLQSAPVGWLMVPTIQTNISRTTYPTLFAQMNALGLPFGAGDGVTTFGMPYIPAGYTWLQATALAAAGVLSHGRVKDHTHTIQPSTQGSGGSAGSQGAFWYTAVTSTPNAPEGGPDNLAAGIGINYIIRVG